MQGQLPTQLLPAREEGGQVLTLAFMGVLALGGPPGPVVVEGCAALAVGASSVVLANAHIVDLRENKPLSAGIIRQGEHLGWPCPCPLCPCHPVLRTGFSHQPYQGTMHS